MASQIFEILRKPGYNYLTQDDFKPVLKELLATHPGLEFLQGTPEFQERYGNSCYPRELADCRINYLLQFIFPPFGSRGCDFFGSRTKDLANCPFLV